MLRAIIIVFVLSSVSSARAGTGDAGCGLGSMIITSNSKLMQLVALTTNSYTGTTFFGITTGTSNCSSQGFVINDKQIDYYVEVNQDQISNEMSQGHGQNLATLAALYGCPAPARADF